MVANYNHNITSSIILSGCEAKELAEEPGNWWLANVEQSIGWIEKETIVYYKNHPILLLPAINDLSPAVAVKFDSSIEANNTKLLLKQFLNALAWSYNRGIRIVMWGRTGREGILTSQLRIKNTSLFCDVTRKTLHPLFLPEPDDKNALLALALYNEGLYLNHEGYSLLSFYKIIELTKKDSEKINWIKNELNNSPLKEYVKKSISNIENELAQDSNLQCKSIGEYLTSAYRCAVAHAGKSHNYDPDSIEDENKFFKSKPLVIYLAGIAIEQKFEILSSAKTYAKHIEQHKSHCQHD